MPFIPASNYKRRPLWMLNGHMETVIPSMFFKQASVNYDRERLELADDDFLDIDWLRDEAYEQLMVITHGLEGSADRYYVKRTADYFHRRGWDILAWNCRSCSGEMNRLPRFYHHGDTDDLASVIDHGVNTKNYKRIVLVGYSMGGSMSLKYLGENRIRPDSIAASVTFSVPCNLADSARQLTLKSNRLYESRFLKKLVEKIKLKADAHPDVIDTSGIDEIKTFDEYHERYTVPLHGFKSMEDFYRKATCDQFFQGINVPSLIVNAENDPLLANGCYPYDQVKELDQVYLEIPSKGGHVGFTMRRNGPSFMEYRIESFLTDHQLM
jgi:predicted alpha/beta-fold hydrolase